MSINITAEEIANDAFMQEFFKDLNFMNNTVDEKLKNQASSTTADAATSPIVTRKRRGGGRKTTATVRKPAEKRVNVPKPTGGSWILKHANDSPSISWCENGCQYSVQNPQNRGKYLVKLQLYEYGLSKHVSGVYVGDEDAEILNKLIPLVQTIENLWVDRQTGTARVEGLIQTITPLAAWRLNNAVTTTEVTQVPQQSKRKRSTSHQPPLQSSVTQ